MDLSYLTKRGISKIVCPKCSSTKAEAKMHATEWIVDVEHNDHARVPFLCQACSERYAVVFKPVEVIPNAWEYNTPVKDKEDDKPDTAALDG